MPTTSKRVSVGVPCKAARFLTGRTKYKHGWQHRVFRCAPINPPPNWCVSPLTSDAAFSAHTNKECTHFTGIVYTNYNKSFSLPFMFSSLTIKCAFISAIVVWKGRGRGVRITGELHDWTGPEDIRLSLQLQNVLSHFDYFFFLLS